MKKKAVYFIAFLLIVVSFHSVYAYTYEVGVDYPDYDLSRGYWKSFCVGLECSLWENFSINISRQPVLLIHGWGNNANGNTGKDDEWGNLQDELEKNFDVWRLDRSEEHTSELQSH